MCGEKPSLYNKYLRRKQAGGARGLVILRRLEISTFALFPLPLALVRPLQCVYIMYILCIHDTRVS